jgi:hypothetical protein
MTDVIITTGNVLRGNLPTTIGWSSDPLMTLFQYMGSAVLEKPIIAQAQILRFLRNPKDPYIVRKRPPLDPEPD